MFSAESGHDIRRFFVLTPMDSASPGSNAFSASRYAQYPAREPPCKDNNHRISETTKAANAKV